MDQVTQIALGAAAAQAVGTTALGRKAVIVGGVAGILPDLDMVLEPLADPLFPIELHRSFTHGLVLVPAVAALTTLLLAGLRPFRRRWLAVFGVALVGAITHAPLDILTSYGTQILWPFSTAWVALDVVAMIDPLYTTVLLVGVLWGALRRAARPARVALLLSCVYLALGVVQQRRALDAQAALIAARGHAPVERRVMPSFVGPLVWRSLYVVDGRIHADAIRLLPFTRPTAHGGGDAPRFVSTDLPPSMPDADHLRRVFRRYETFAGGFTARTPHEPAIVGDMRFSLGYGFEPLWGVRVAPPEPASWTDRFEERLTDAGGTIRHVGALSLGTAGDFGPLP